MISLPPHDTNMDRGSIEMGSRASPSIIPERGPVPPLLIGLWALRSEADSLGRTDRIRPCLRRVGRRRTPGAVDRAYVKG